MKAIIMAGGKGTRIASVNSEVPKPMIEICGKPVLQWQIECLVSQGVTDITIVIGHLGKIIRGYFDDGLRFNCNISYVVEEAPLGTAGALTYLRDKIDDDFLLINSDIIFDIDIDRFYKYHKEHNCTATIFTHPNSHPYDSGIIVANAQSIVTSWLNKEDERRWYKNRVNAGIHMLSPRVFAYLSDDLVKLDLDRDILRKLIPSGELMCYDSPEYVKDMGTPERFNQVEKDIKSGVVKAKNLNNKQRALFLDRDGTINKYKGFLTDINEFELNDGLVDIIRTANEKGWLVIVITNQPVIARGDISWEELYEIHNKMETLIGEHGAYVDDIFICPHHPDKGFPGERVEYKIDCDCRKPKPGMINLASIEYNINIGNSIVIGDSDSDIFTAINAGCKGIKIDTDSFNWIEESYLV
ncbi:histidinol phosphate phosphatase [Clostridia bacterium]|nr:histidinol phosphate phosphatase [Clostridia bacterium]